MTNPDQRPGLVAAILRLLLLAIIPIAEELVDPQWLTSPFLPTLALAFAYTLVTLVTAITRRRLSTQCRIEPILDIAFLCALDLSSGGAVSQVRKAFFVLPLAAVFAVRPRHTALWGLLALAGFLAVSLPHPDARDPGGGEFILVEALYLTWTGVAATLLAWLLAARAQRITRLASDRGRLVARTLQAVEDERKRLAYRLHDEAVQHLLVAKRELRTLDTADEPHRRAALAAVQAALGQLREAIFELQPLALQQTGLTSSVRQLAENHSRQRASAIDVTLDEQAAGPHDQLIYAVARELLGNATQHANAEHIEITLERHNGQIMVEVADNGQGIATGRREQALQQGHIGLAATTERVEAFAGTLAIDTAPGRGSIITASIPARRTEDHQTGLAKLRLANDRRRP
ncbi:MAG: ATP-binding protein [Actinomycetota bacterium]|nr:ATP-binding protein [Actinomycetota bacterium]